MGAACGCCRPNEEEGPKDDDDRHDDREPLLQREGSHGSIEDVRPTDQFNDEPVILREQQHIDLVNNHPLSSQSPSKGQLYVQKRSRSPNKRDGIYFENPNDGDSESQDSLGASDRQSTTLSPTDVKPEVPPNVTETSVLLHNQGRNVQKQSRSPSKRDGIYFENPHEVDSESQDSLGEVDSQSTTLSPTDVKSEVPPNFTETSVLLRTQGPLVSPLIADDVLVDPIAEGSREIQGTQGDPKFSEWVSAEDDTIPEIGALNKDRSSVLFDLQNTSTSPAGFGVGNSPHGLNPASPIGPNAAIPLIPSTVSGASNIPTIDWSGNILPSQQAHGQLGRDAEYGLLSSAGPGPVLASQPPATSNRGPVAAIGDSAGEYINSSAADKKKDLRHNEANAPVSSMDETLLKTSRQENLSKLHKKEVTLIGKHDPAMVAASKGQNQVTRDPLSIHGGAVDVQAEARVHQPQSMPSETETNIGLNVNKEQAVSSQGHHPPTKSLNLETKVQRSDIFPVVLDNTQTPDMPKVTIVEAGLIHPTVTTDVSRAAAVAADVEKEDIPVDNVKNNSRKKKKKGKKGDDSNGSSKDDTIGQRKDDSALGSLPSDSSAADDKGKQETDDSVVNRIPVSLSRPDQQGNDKTEILPREDSNGDGASSHVSTLMTDTSPGKPTNLANVFLGVEDVEAVKMSTVSINVPNGHVTKGAVTKDDSEPSVNTELAITINKTEEVASRKQSGKESFDANANLQRLKFEETGLPELDEKYKLQTHLFNEYFDKFNLLQTDYRQMLTAYEKTGLRCSSLLPVFIMLKSELGEDAKGSLKLERNNCYQIIFEPDHISEKGAAIFRYFNSSNLLLTDLISEGRNSVLECTKMIIDSEDVTKNIVSERSPGLEQEDIKLAVSKVVVMMRNVIPSVNYMINEATRVQNDLEGAALVLFTQEEEKERVEEHLTTQRSFIKL